MDAPFWLKNRAINVVLRLYTTASGTVEAYPTPECTCGQPFEEGAVCACLQRHTRIRDIAVLIAQTHRSPNFPVPLPGPSVSPSVKHHLPVFVFVCPGCGQRENTYSIGWRGEPTFDAAPTWHCLTEPVPEEVQRTVGYTIRTLFVCSPICAEAVNARQRR